MDVVLTTCNLGCPTGTWEAETGEPWQSIQASKPSTLSGNNKQKILSQKCRRQGQALKLPRVFCHLHNREFIIVYKLKVYVF